jgi:hypothetical protein
LRQLPKILNQPPDVELFPASPKVHHRSALLRFSEFEHELSESSESSQTFTEYAARFMSDGSVNLTAVAVTCDGLIV